MWIATGIAAAGLVALPIAAVVGQFLAPDAAVWSHLMATTLPEIFGNTARLLLGVALGCIVVGVATAWIVTMYEFPGRRLFEWALVLPLAMPAYIIGYAYSELLTFAGPVQSSLRAVFEWRRSDYWFPDIHGIGGVVGLLTLVLYPYVYLLARAAFLEQSVCVLEASRTLGCNNLSALRRVALPLARPAIAAGTGLALMETLAEFGLVQYFGVQTFTTAIYNTWFGLGNRPAAAQLASVLVVFVLVLVILERGLRGGRRYHHTTSRYRPIPRQHLSGAEAALAVVVCACPILLGFGGGEHLIWQARHNPDVGIVGCEPFEEGVVKVLTAIEEQGLANVRLWPDDARDLLRRLPPGSLARVFVLFPDPWPKKRHVKRRLLSAPVLALIARALGPGGRLRIATDIADYARTILMAAAEVPALAWTARSADDWRRRPPDWPKTRYEQKAEREGRRSVYLELVRRPGGC